MILEGKTVIVSGVGNGLGREIALAAARDGANVVLGARTEPMVEKVASEIDSSGNRVAWRRTDITSPTDCEALVATAIDKFGGAHALMNVAALDAIFGGLTDSDFQSWRDAIEINLIGTMQMTKSALPALKRQGGAVVFIGSQTILMPPPEMPQMGYAASKGGLLAAAYHLAREVGPDKIRVNTVIASWMWGPEVQLYVQMTAQSQGVSEETVLAGITKDIPLGEMATIGDVAEAVVFLASDRARAITGQSLIVNAGEVMR